MIVVKLLGGLGNQLFQYAIGRSLSKQNNSPLFLDLQDYQLNKERVYELNGYPVKAKIASPDFIANIQFDNRLWKRIFLLNKWTIIKEKYTHYDSNIFLLRGNLYLNGYWNCFRYFEHNREELLKELNPRQYQQYRTTRIAKRVSTENSVSVHIRRGDYVSNPLTRKKHGLLPMAYYQQAIDSLSSKYPNLEYFIFTDDYEWVTKNCNFSPNQHIVQSQSSISDLYYQSLCRHHIIANSTYSWWGAWLGDQKGHTIAPREWQATPKPNLSDIYLPEWIIV